MIYPPTLAEQMQTKGEVAHVHPNGRIQYEGQVRQASAMRLVAMPGPRFIDRLVAETHVACFDTSLHACRPLSCQMAAEHRMWLYGRQKDSWQLQKLLQLGLQKAHRQRSSGSSRLCTRLKLLWKPHWMQLSDQQHS